MKEKNSGKKIIKILRKFDIENTNGLEGHESTNKMGKKL